MVQLGEYNISWSQGMEGPGSMMAVEVVSLFSLFPPVLSRLSCCAILVGDFSPKWGACFWSRLGWNLWWTCSSIEPSQDLVAWGLFSTSGLLVHLLLGGQVQYFYNLSRVTVWDFQVVVVFVLSEVHCNSLSGSLWKRCGDERFIHDESMFHSSIRSLFARFLSGVLRGAFTPNLFGVFAHFVQDCVTPTLAWTIKPLEKWVSNVLVCSLRH